MRFAFFILIVAFAMPATNPVRGCEWDYDTLEMERQRFPGVLELVTGKFSRHSEAFYRWRVADRLKRIESEPENARLYDDLAVAYDKLGEQAKAIETIEKVEAFAPGRYETAANLGTFHVHAGNLATGLEHLRRAVEINPDAHFGREIYQILLIEYVIAKRGEDGTVPRPLDVPPDRWSIGSEPGFTGFVYEQQGTPTDGEERKAELERATKGVLGMLRFGSHDSPVLLEAAGDLLSADNRDDGKQLAARAYLKASYEVEDEAAREGYRSKARAALELQVDPGSDDQVELAAIEKAFRDELDEAEAWYAEVAADEQRWIDEGVNVDEAFSEKYYTDPVVGESADAESDLGLSGLPMTWRIAIGAALVMLVIVGLAVAWRQSSLLAEHGDGEIR